ncbi:MAG: hypothetical protein H0V04_04220 [Chloroflexi bacterium]|nr:hypothetical protein [Chloroflexota bacterium]
MAVRALPPGAIRRRAFFGLLDADGWTAAFLKALFWFLLSIFLLGYVPDRAYYFTVSKTIDLGYNAVPLVNFCPAANETLPCPAPKGAVVPWQASPAELKLPAPAADAAAFQSGTNLYLIGGRDASGPTDQTLATTVTAEGNLAPWADGPALPEQRTDFAFASLSGVPYVIGGTDASGAPTATVFQGVLEEGVLTGWQPVEDLGLPASVSDATAVATGAGILLIGGRTADGLVPTVWEARFGEGNPPTLGAWAELGLPLPEPRAEAAAVLVGERLYVMGGEGPGGVTGGVYRLELPDGEPVTDPASGQLQGWASPVAGSPGGLPEPRARAAAFTANGVLYVLGGANADGQPQATTLWTIPDPATGDLPAWSRRTETELPDARAGSAVANVGSYAFLIGGDGASGQLDGSLRASISPQPPFFRFGLFGLTVPALAIQGEIGQQLGYINAAGSGTAMFIGLILIALAYSHRQGTMRFIERVSRGRIRAPREEEYPAYTERRR